MREESREDGERGAIALEYIGIVIFVGLVIAAIKDTQIADQIASALVREIKEILG